MIKYLALLFFCAAIGFMIGAHASPGSGYEVGAIAAAVLGIIIMVISKVRTGKWFTDEAGGH
jgi:hypothetical protein